MGCKNFINVRQYFA